MLLFIVRVWSDEVAGESFYTIEADSALEAENEATSRFLAGLRQFSGECASDVIAEAIQIDPESGRFIKSLSE